MYPSVLTAFIKLRHWNSITQAVSDSSRQSSILVLCTEWLACEALTRSTRVIGLDFLSHLV